MKEAPASGLSSERARAIAAAPSRLLLLDYDGTLAPFRVERMVAIPYDGVREAVSKILARGFHVAVISGRLAREVVELLGVYPPPEVVGCHGWERLSAEGSIARLPLSARQSEGLARAEYILANEGWRNRIEIKHGSLALHWRGASEAEQREIEFVGERAMGSLAGKELALKQFDGGLELRALGEDKGSAVRRILAERETRLPVYLGDDLTDEDAFRAAAAAGGFGCLVRNEWRETGAGEWLKPPEELLEFLNFWLDPVVPPESRTDPDPEDLTDTINQAINGPET